MIKNFKDMEREVFKDVIRDAKMELSFTDNRNIDLLCLPYHVRMNSMLDGIKLVCNNKSFIKYCSFIIREREDKIKKEITEFARSLA